MRGGMVLDRKIAYVNLSDGSYEIKKIPMHLLSKSYASIPDPFSTDNPLIFGAGLLNGIPGFGSRMNITSRSPESGHLGDSNMGGEFGAEMVKAGLSHLVITGKSKKPVYLFKGKSYHWDLCGGNPQCVKVCTTGALVMSRP
jgi:aldehyde:ferredoxin oxidoreductase